LKRHGAAERFVKKIDAHYQRVVDDLADEFLRRSPEELSEQPDYGSIPRQIDGDDVSVAFWHYRLKENVDHIVFITERRLLIPSFYRKFISGVVFGPTTNQRLMTEKEVGNYE
jgi:hypothetical protein